MNNWNKLKQILDQLFGHGVNQQSRIVRKVQGFDNKTQEHIIRIEYRVRLLDESDKRSLIQNANDQAGYG